MLKLYYAPRTCSLATHIALEDVGADYSTVRISFAANQQQSPDYLKINPKGRVPALVTDRGILTETPAMLAFVAQSFPAAQLAPLDDPFAFAEVQAFNSYLCSTLHIAHAHRMRGHRWVDAEDAAAIAAMQRKVPQSVTAGFEQVEHDMFKGPWVMGERYTICDPYLFTLAQWLEADGVDLARIPKVVDHRRRMSERPNVKKAIAQEFAP
ncbi:glutathione S-transferase family protein [Reyranella massiliensis]|jgi:glutathione S-transferase|uniref:glutathione S-transferase family protein n=1 Tax=Reyranella massiliensis TaxID=445220 RepID=UPI0002DAF9BF|nr:glutathione S-transferase N-terminal domain-containing protein [Reyranella massiliensis]